MIEEKDGPVHYQVSVTGRQAAAFFLVLLASLGLSFFFGMKTGAAARRGPDPVSALAAQSDIPVPTAPASDGSGRATPVPTEVPIGFDTPPPARVREAAPRPEPTPREDPRPVVRELASPTPARPTPAPARAETAEAARDDGPFWVQILVTGSAEKADGLSKRLKASGFPSDVSVVPGREGLFRVRIGPYPDRAKAEAAVTKVTKAEKLQDKPIVVPGK